MVLEKEQEVKGNRTGTLVENWPSKTNKDFSSLHQ